MAENFKNNLSKGKKNSSEDNFLRPLEIGKVVQL
jgi:hypothetical protein